MPNGYLKHQKGVSRKMASGNGTCRGRKDELKECDREVMSKHKARQSAIAACAEWEMIIEEDEAKTVPLFWKCTACTFLNRNVKFLSCAVCGTERSADDDDETQVSARAAPTADFGTCSICCEEDVALIHLTKGCKKTHEPACHACLRRIHVTGAQQSIANFPLQCHHPQCRLAVCGDQLARHNLVRTRTELTRHFRLTELAKVHRLADRKR